ncbi:hypothetical protein F53441_2995 [Fusarium austroafricanum]|uniref:TMEM205-like domain-containing protein n=1 Tax=Fusarium austroafricanum TaxID=2364996 RepID=A0A8H4KQ29_9HYPO|nr:hypothetical protein F53441_2995 [Fusarium austroafricanum]
MAIVTALLPTIHLFSFSTLLGSQLYQTFIITRVAFKHLPRTPYVNFQKHIFPIFFNGQAILLFLAAVTLPPYGPLSLIERKRDWIPFAASGVVSGLNLMVFGPRTRKLMLDRAEQDSGGTKLCNAGSQDKIFYFTCNVYSLELDWPWGSSLVHLGIGLSFGDISVTGQVDKFLT